MALMLLTITTPPDPMPFTPSSPEAVRPRGMTASGPSSPMSPMPEAMRKTVGRSTIPPAAKGMRRPALKIPPFSKNIPEPPPNRAKRSRDSAPERIEPRPPNSPPPDPFRLSITICASVSDQARAMEWQKPIQTSSRLSTCPVKTAKKPSENACSMPRAVCSACVRPRRKDPSISLKYFRAPASRPSAKLPWYSFSRSTRSSSISRICCEISLCSRASLRISRWPSRSSSVTCWDFFVMSTRRRDSSASRIFRARSCSASSLPEAVTRPRPSFSERICSWKFSREIADRASVSA
ncbi:MAG: hypothetical protein BWY99_02801 [Synergistetes bacterium ADurb.BinA166]|nr:MAG: hypothetical protein BWY99_02801 [Synergistetes bacterium ADurb.BinA166]